MTARQIFNTVWSLCIIGFIIAIFYMCCKFADAVCTAIGEGLRRKASATWEVTDYDGNVYIGTNVWIYDNQVEMRTTNGAITVFNAKHAKRISP